MRARIFLAAVLVPGLAPSGALALDEPVRIPLKHVVAWGEGGKPDQLGIMVVLDE